LEPQPALLPHLALLGEGGGAATVGEEAGVAPPSPSSFGGFPPVADADEVGQDEALLVGHGRALGHRHKEVATAGAVHALALAVDAVAGGAVRVVAERQPGGTAARG